MLYDINKGVYKHIFVHHTTASICSNFGFINRTEFGAESNLEQRPENWKYPFFELKSSYVTKVNTEKSRETLKNTYTTLALTLVWSTEPNLKQEVVVEFTANGASIWVNTKYFDLVPSLLDSISCII